MLITVWSLLEECVSQLAEPFRRSEIIGWFRRHRPEVNEATLAAHIQGGDGERDQSGAEQSARDASAVAAAR